MRTTPIAYLDMEEARICLQVVEAAYATEVDLDKRVKLQARALEINKRIHALEIQIFQNYKTSKYEGKDPEYCAWLKEVNGW